MKIFIYKTLFIFVCVFVIFHLPFAAKINQLNKDQIKIKNQIESILVFLPNLALGDVPVGKDDRANKEINKIGEQFNTCFSAFFWVELSTVYIIFVY